MPVPSIGITWRRLRNDRSFTLLNIIGLSVALTSAILIYYWVQDERGIDQFHDHRKRLYQVMSHISLPDGIHTQEATPYLLARGIAREIPEVELSVAVMPGKVRSMISNGETHIRTDRTFVDTAFFRLFTFPLLNGNPDNPFPQLRSVLLSASLAAKLFHGSTDVVGEPVQWGDEKMPFIVSGIFRDPPENSSLRFQMLCSYEWYYRQDSANAASWENSNPSTYFLIKQGVNADRLAKKMTAYLNRKSGGQSPLSLSVIPFSDKYLYDKYENGVQIGGRITYVRLFSLIGLFIVLVAVINFINLSTSRAAGRAHDSGVRKLVGASRFSLIIGYYLESMMICFLALIAALILAGFLIPAFNATTGKHLTILLLLQRWPSLVGISLCIAASAGCYPAVYLSGFNAVSVLKGKMPANKKAGLFRMGLVVFQYGISVLLIIAVIVIYRQLTYIRTFDTGYRKENVIYFKNEARLNDHLAAFKSDLASIPGVTGVSNLNGDLFGATSGNTEFVDWPGKSEKDHVLFTALDIDYGLAEVLNFKLIAGRTFMKLYASDDSAIMLNNAAIRAMGISDPIGKTVRVWGGTFHVIGIFNDFHFESIYEKVKPCFFRLNTSGASIFVKMHNTNQPSTIAAIENIYRLHNSGLPFEYKFLDEAEAALYKSDQTLGTLSKFAAVLAIVISALGLFGMAAFTAQQRQKEFSIRKIIGASGLQLASLLGAGFIKLIALALLIAMPVAAWLMNEWLSHFAFRININYGIFFKTIGLIMAITLGTIIGFSVKVATANPVKVLRSE